MPSTVHHNSAIFDKNLDKIVDLFKSYTEKAKNLIVNKNQLLHSLNGPNKIY